MHAKNVTNKEKCLHKPLDYLHSALWDPSKKYFAAKSCAANECWREWQQLANNANNRIYMDKLCTSKYATNKEKYLCKPVAHLHSACQDPSNQYFAAKSFAAN